MPSYNIDNEASEKSSSGYNIYLGQGDLAAVDWSNPVAHVGPAGGDVSVHLPAQAGQAYTLAARAVSAAGVEECNTHVILALVGAADGRLIQRLDAPTDVCALLTGRSVSLAFRFTRSQGAAAPESFDVFTDGGTGSMNLNSAVASLSLAGQPEGCFSIVFEASTLPAGFAVAARRGDQTGSPSSVVQLATANPTAPTFL